MHDDCSQTLKTRTTMRIEVASIFVEDQQKALDFYTRVVGFEVQKDAPMGEDRWLTVSSPDGVDGVELLLEPNRNPIAKTYQSALKESGIPATTFGTEDIHAEVERLKEAGVDFSVELTEAEWGSYAVFDDTCGNLISIAQHH